MRFRRSSRVGAIAIAIAVLLISSTVASAQVASLRTPDPNAEPTASPDAEPDSQDALIGFSRCMREHGIDLPDPKFGMSGYFASGAMDGIDMLSDGFVDAFGACQGLLAATIPAVDPAQQAERTERAVAFAECMREAGIEFTGVSMYRVEDDGVAEIWDTRNSLGIMQQLKPDLMAAGQHH